MTRKKCESGGYILGVGDGSGKLYVHGDIDSIMAAQAIIFERDQLKAEIEKHKSNANWLMVKLNESYAENKKLKDAMKAS